VDVCVLGRIGYDLYAVEHNRPLAEVERFSRCLGGSSANIAVGLARLGLCVGIISCIGKDLLADYLMGFLKKEGVDTQHVRLVEGHNTSLCLTEVSPPDHFPQVFYRCEPADSQVILGPAEEAYIRQAHIFLTNGTSLSASPARESTVKALQIAYEGGLRTVLDIDYRASSWPSPEAAGRAALDVLSWVDVVVGNEDEFRLLTGEVDVRRQVEAVLASGVRIMVRKLGARGVEAHTPQQSCLAEPVPVKVVSTIGAGDGFAAGFLYAFDRSLPLETCLRYGNAAAAIVVSRLTCSEAMPYPEELAQVLGQTSAAQPGARN
jgi:5-dehydro-2-deoxygluconokinase